MTRETALALEALCKEMDAPVEEVMTQAFGLLMVAVEGQKQEQRLCLVDDDSNVVMEIVNFGIENDRDRDDSSLDDAADRFDS